MLSKKTKKDLPKENTFKFPKIKNIFPILHSAPSRRKNVNQDTINFLFRNKTRAPKDTWSYNEIENIPSKVILHPSFLNTEIIAFKSGPDCGVDYVESLFNKKKIDIDKIQFKHKQRFNFEKHYEVLENKVGCSSVSLYERNPLNGKLSGEPIADSYLVCTRANNSILLVADGVNWGRQAKMASRCAVYGCYRHLEKRLIQQFRQQKPSDYVYTTADVFKWLTESIDAAQELIILSETPGFTTLCVSVVVPLARDDFGKLSSSHFAVCTVNIGDSLAFLLSRYHGIREITVGSHSLTVARDFRETGGALGKVYKDNSPELNNMTFSMTMSDPGDIIILTSDGITDNFDPIINKIAMPVSDLFPFIDSCPKGCDHHFPFYCTCSSSKDDIECSAMEINFTGKMELLPEERQQYAVKQIERVWHDAELRLNLDNGSVHSTTCRHPSSHELCQALVSEVYKATKQKRQFLEKQYLHDKDENSSDLINESNSSTKRRVKLYAKSHSTAGAAHEQARKSVKLRHQRSLDSTETSRIPSINAPPVPPSLNLCPENLFISSESVQMITSSRMFYRNNNRPLGTSTLLTSIHPGKLDHATVIATEIGDWNDTALFNGYYYPIDDYDDDLRT